MNPGNTIVIVGAGAAGLACALAAARQGAKVHLLEQTAAVGGTIARSLIHTIGGLYDDRGEHLNAGLSLELATRLRRASDQTTKRQIGKVWTLSVDPALYQAVVAQWLAHEPNITLWRNAYPLRIDAVRSAGHGGRDQHRVTQIEFVQGAATKRLPVAALVDATGQAAVTRLLDPHKVVEGDALAGLIFQIRGVVPGSLQFPKNIALQRELQKAVTVGQLPGLFARTWLDIGVYADEVYAKANLATIAYARALAEGATTQSWQEPLLHFLRQSPGFAQAAIVQVGQLGVRDGGRIKGEYCLTVADVKGGRRFADAVGRCAWPIEYWDPDKGVTLDYLPVGQAYEIPLRALKVLGTENLWAAGKCLSADKLAQASARIAGACWAMGDGLGQAIAKENGS